MQRLTVVVGVAVAMLAATGCAPHYPPSQEVILDYLKKARLIHFRTGKAEGKVRRLWPAGQTYVDGVMEADAALQKQLDPLRTLDNPLSLWGKDDPVWRDEDAVIESLSKVAKLVEAYRPARAAAYDKLAKAIDKVPDDIGAKDPASRDAFIDSVWEALAVHGTPIRDGALTNELVAIGQQYLDLYHAVQKCRGDFDTQDMGLAFSTDSCDTEVGSAYDKLAQGLTERRETMVGYAEKQLAEARAAAKDIDKKGQRLKYEYLLSLENYFEVELEDIPKQIQAATAARREDLRHARRIVNRVKIEDRKRGEEEIAYLESRIDQLTAAHTKWQERITPLLTTHKPSNAESKSQGDQ